MGTVEVSTALGFSDPSIGGTDGVESTGGGVIWASTFGNGKTSLGFEFGGADEADGVAEVSC